MIFVLVITNLVLAGILIYTLLGNQLSSKNTANTLKILEERNVFLNCDIPRRMDFVTSLKSMQMNRFVREEKMDFTEEDIQGNNPKPEILLRRWLLNREDEKTLFEDLKFYAQPKKEIILFKQQVDGRVLFENQVIFQKERDSWNISVAYEKVEKLGDKHYVMPVHQVLLKNFTHVDQPVEITKIDLGYLQKTVRIMDVDIVYMPVWGVLLKNGEERFFNAFSGEPV